MGPLPRIVESTAFSRLFGRLKAVLNRTDRSRVGEDLSYMVMSQDNYYMGLLGRSGLYPTNLLSVSVDL